MGEIPFWETKPLEVLTDTEREALCDGCGRCCLHKLLDDRTEEIFYTRVACKQLDFTTAKCTSYDTRSVEVSSCLNVRKLSDHELKWMPTTCAYRLIAESRPLPSWHPLITGDPNSTEKAGFSVTNHLLKPESPESSDLQAEIITWVKI